MIAHRETLQSDARPPLQFWFDFGSNYSYLAVMRIEDLASEAGVHIEWKPFLLGPVFRSLGWETSPFVVQRQKGAYVWQDMIRQCRKYGIPWRKPSVFPRSAVLASRVAVAGAGEPWIGAYCRRMMTLNFAEDRDIDSRETVAEVLEALGLPPEEIIAAAESDANRPRLRAQTEEAQARAIFGAPTFFAGDEMFWGNDRLADALQWAADLRNVR